jgi:hypothetical protein
MKFEKEINILNDDAIARQFESQNTAINAVAGKISAVISDSETTEYINGNKTVASELHSVTETISEHTSKISKMESSIDKQGDSITDLSTRYNEQIQNLDSTVSAVGRAVETKNTVFSTTPTVPYKTGDLWLNNGEVYRSIVTKNEGEYSENDWVKATTYTTPQFVEDNYYTKSTTDSLISQSADDIRFTVKKEVQDDVLKNYYTTAEVKLYVDGELSNFKVDADNINFKGKTIDLKSNSLDIKGDSVHIYNNGMTCEYLSFGLSSMSQGGGINMHVKTRSWEEFDTKLGWDTVYGGDNIIIGSEYPHDRSFIDTTPRHEINTARGNYPGSVVEHYPMIVIKNNEGSNYGIAIFGDNYIDLKRAKYSNSHVDVNNLNADFVNCSHLWCTGTKARIIEDTAYGNILMNAYETPTPMFGDVGEGIIGESGEAIIWFDPRFMETIDPKAKYQVFLQNYSANPIYVSDRKTEYFVVKGTPGDSFAWEVKCRQAKIDMGYMRFHEEKVDRSLFFTKDYDTMADRYIEKIKEERITSYERSNSSNGV